MRAPVRRSSSPTSSSNFKQGGPALRPRKNLTPYDVLIIASLVEREAQLPQGAAAHRIGDLQPAPRRHPARHRRHHAVRGRQLEAAAAVVRAPDRRRPYNTRVHPGLPPGPIGNPGLASIKAAAHPAKTEVPVLRGQAVAAAAGTPSRRPTPSSSATWTPTTAPATRTAASRRPTADAPSLGVLGFPVGHSRSPAMMNAAFRELGLDWRYVTLPVPPERFAETVRALPASGYRGRQRDDPAQAAPRTTWPTS